MGLLLRRPDQRRHRGDVRDDLLVGEQPDLLDHVADPASELHRVLRGDVASLEEDPAGGGLDQPVDHLQRGGLPAARRPDQDDQLAGRHLEVELVHRHRPVGVLLADPLEPDHRLGRWSPGADSSAGRGSVHARDPTRGRRDLDPSPAATAGSSTSGTARDYLKDRHQRPDRRPSSQHLQITAWSILLGVLDRLPARAAGAPAAAAAGAILGTSTMIYTIPSLALFPFLVPFTGISMKTVVIGLGALRPHDPGPQHARGTARRTRRGA